MSSVDLTGRLWINLAADPSQKWWFTYVTSITSNPSLNAALEIDAAGNVGVIVTPGNLLTYPVALVACDAAQREALETLLPGRSVWVRDDRSRKLGAIFTNPQISEHQYNGECDITVTFNRLDLVEIAL